jgi:DNA-binding Xre family transcriptional regulator
MDAHAGTGGVGGTVGPADRIGPAETVRAGETFSPAKTLGPAETVSPAELPLPVLPGFREMALRRMAGDRRRLVTELTAQRVSARLSQTEVAARMGTSQSAVARLEAGEADVRTSTLERYAAAIGSEITWRLQDTPPVGRPQGRQHGDG